MLLFYFLRRTKNHFQKQTVPIYLFDKKLYSKQRQMSYVKCYTSNVMFYMNRVDVDKLQATVYIFGTKKCSRTFKASWEEVFVMRSEKKKDKYMKLDVWKSLFRKLTSWNLATSLRSNLFTNYSQVFYLNAHFRMANSFFCTKGLKAPAKEYIVAYASWNSATCTWNQ